MPVLESGGWRIDYLDEGQGPAVLLIHSASSSYKQWRPLMDALSPDHRVLAINLFGYGDTSPWPAGREQTVQDQVEQRIRALCEGTAASHGATIAVRYERRYPPTVNSAAEAELCARVAEGLVGAERVARDKRPAMGSEDFAWMLRARPGAYMWVGNGTGGQGGCMVHNPGYDFNDAILPVGAAYWVRLAETALAKAR